MSTLPKFFTIRNLSDLEVAPMEKPWEFDSSKAPWDLEKTKFKAWMKTGSTNHCLFSMIEPLNPYQPVSKGNEVNFIHGFVADYDGAVMDEADIMKVVEERAPVAMLPNYVTITKTKKTRLIWFFEHPMRVMGNDHATGLLKYIGKILNADKWFPGFDAASFDPKQFWCIGRKWIPTSRVDTRIRGCTINAWQQDYFIHNAKKLVDCKSDIPLTDLEAEAVRRGFQKVPRFEAGQHSRRFWDAASDNDEGCLITPYGVCVYVPHDKPFMSWRDIFGHDFTAQYEDKGYEKFFENVFFDHNRNEFWFKTECGDFIRRTSESISRHLKILGCSSTREKGQTCSELDKRMLFLETNHCVDRVDELLYLPVGVFCDFDGTKVLNKTRIRVIEPSNPQCDARLPWNSPEVARAFPFLHGLFNHLLAKIPIPGWEEGSPTQVDFLIWHMARFYRSGYYRRGGKGHALFIAGGAGQGKSLFAEIIYPRLMGGVGRDAFSFISGKTKWSGGLANLPVLSINDGAAYKGGIANVIGDALKKVTADGTMESNVKFGNEGFVKWRGRFIVTLNTDHDSTRILPTINNSVRDKFIYLLAESDDNNKYEAFGTEEENERRIMAELPIFARYLLDCYVPVEGDPWFDKRFGFKAWQHPTLLDRSSLDDRSACLIDAFEELWGCAPKTDKRGKKLYWEGSAATLYRMLSWGGGDAVHGNESFRKTFTTPQSLGRALASSVEKGYDIKDTTKGKRPSKTWRVSYDVYLDSAEAEQAVATPAPVVAQVPVAVRDAEPEPVPDEVVIIDGIAVRKAKGQPA